MAFGGSTKFYNLIQQLKPHGPGNMSPIFRTNNIKDSGGSRIVKEKHLKLGAIQKGIKFDGIGFGLSEIYEVISKNKPFDACYSIEMNEYQGNQSLQLRIRDIRPV